MGAKVSMTVEEGGDLRVFCESAYTAPAPSSRHVLTVRPALTLRQTEPAL